MFQNQPPPPGFVLNNPQPSPAASGGLTRITPPKAPDPAQEAKDARSENRADTNTGLSVKSGERSAKDQVQGFRKEFTSRPEYRTYGISMQSLSNAIGRAPDASGDASLIYDWAKAMDPESVVRESEVGLAQTGQSMVESAAARMKKELGYQEGGLLDPKNRERLIREIITAAKSRRKAYEQQRDYYTGIAERSQFNPEDVVGPHLGEPFRDDLSRYGVSGRRFTDEEMAARSGRPAIPGAEKRGPAPEGPTGNFSTAVNTDALGPGETFVFDETGQPVGIRAADGTLSGYSAIVDNVSEREARDKLEAYGDMDYATGGQAGLYRGVSLGFSDELAGLAGGVNNLINGKGFGEGYRRERDVERVAQDISRKEAGILPEIAGSIVAPVGALGTARNAGQFIRQGAALGAAAGVGEGEGLADSIKRGAVGSVVGGALGGAISQAPRLANAALQSPAGQRATGAIARSIDRVRRPVGQLNQEVVDAGQRADVPVRLPDALPEARNAMAVAEASPTAGEGIRRTLNDDTALIQQRLRETGGSGTALDNTDLGSTIQNAGLRYIANSRQQANTLYNRAERAAGDVQILPVQASQAIRRNINELAESGETTNSAAIQYLRDLNSDIARDGGMSIQALRNLRTNMRGQIDQRGLTRTDTDRRVSEVLDAASEDISRALANNPQARDAYRAADEFFREKQNFIKDVVQKFTGPRVDGQTVAKSPEQAASTLRAMMQSQRGDTRRFQEMVARLDPEERSDLAASVADQLGTAKNGEFSLAALSSNTSKMNPRALRLLFGDDGARAIQDLRVLARAKADTLGGLNNSKSGVVAAGTNQFKDLVLGAVGGGTVGVPGAMAGMAARGALERLSSGRATRLLLNPDFTRWARQLPDRASPEVVERQFNKLNRLLSREQAFVMDAKAIQDFVTRHFSEGVGRAAATGDQGKNDRRE